MKNDDYDYFKCSSCTKRIRISRETELAYSLLMLDRMIACCEHPDYWRTTRRAPRCTKFVVTKEKIAVAVLDEDIEGQIFVYRGRVISKNEKRRLENERV